MNNSRFSTCLALRGVATSLSITALAIASRAQNAGYSLRKFADTSGAYVSFGYPAINDAGHVAVLATKANGAREIVRMTPAGIQTLVSEQGDIASLGTGTNQALVLNDAGFVAYSAVLTTGEQAIRLTDGSTTHELARNTLLPNPSNTVWNGTPSLTGGIVVLNDNNQIAFLATDPMLGPTVMFRASIAGLSEVARSSSDMSSPFISVKEPGIDNAGRVLAHVSYWTPYAPSAACAIQGRDALVRFEPSGASVTLAIDSSTLVSSNHTQHGTTLLTDNGETIYLAGCEVPYNVKSLARADGTNQTPLVVYDPGLGTTTYRDVTRPSIDSQGRYVFYGWIYGGQHVISKGPNSTTDVVVAPGDVLGGAAIIAANIGNDALNDGGQIAFFANLPDRTAIGVASPPPPAPNSYCTAGASAHGCTPQISSIGTPLSAGQSSFLVVVAGLPANVNTLFLYSVSGAQAVPWGNSTAFLCVRSPLQRMAPILSSGGSVAPACDGTASIDWNAYVASHPGVLGTPFDHLDDVWMQAYYRDPTALTGPVHAKGTKLSNALHFQVGL